MFRIFIVAIVAVSLLVIPSVSYAQSTAAPTGCSAAVTNRGILDQGRSNECINCGRCNLCDVINTISGAANYILAILAPLGGLALLIAGIMYMTSGGDQNQLGAAKKAITTSIIGIILILGAWLIVNTILNSLGASNKGNWFQPQFDCTNTRWASK